MPDWVWGLYEALPHQTRVRGRVFLHFLLTVLRKIPVSILRGVTAARGLPYSIAIAGTRPWVEYLPDLFFQAPPEPEPLGSVPWWTLSRTLDRLALSANLVIARVDRISSHLLLDSRYLLVPEWVEVRLDVTQDLEATWSRSSSVQRDLQRIRKNDLSHELSYSDADFRLWYSRYYVPFLRKRHTKYGVIASMGRLRPHFRRGALLWVIHRGQRIAGMLMRQQGEVLHGLTLGTKDGEYSALRLGAIAAIYYHAFHYAKTHGCHQVRFGGTRPIVTDGDVRYKRKWGLRLVERADTYQFAVRCERLDEAVLGLLTQTPLTYREQGYLSAVAAVDSEGPATQDEAAQAHRSLWTSGLHRLYLLSATGWEPGVHPPQDTRPIDLAGSNGEEFPQLLTSGSLA